MQREEKQNPFHEERRLNNFPLASLSLSELSGICLCILDTKESKGLQLEEPVLIKQELVWTLNLKFKTDLSQNTLDNWEKNIFHYSLSWMFWF